MGKSKTLHGGRGGGASSSQGSLRQIQRWLIHLRPLPRACPRNCLSEAGPTTPPSSCSLFPPPLARSLKSHWRLKTARLKVYEPGSPRAGSSPFRQRFGQPESSLHEPTDAGRPRGAISEWECELAAVAAMESCNDGECMHDRHFSDDCEVEEEEEEGEHEKYPYACFRGCSSERDLGSTERQLEINRLDCRVRGQGAGLRAGRPRPLLSPPLGHHDPSSTTRFPGSLPGGSRGLRGGRSRRSIQR